MIVITKERIDKTKIDRIKPLALFGGQRIQKLLIGNGRRYRSNIEALANVFSDKEGVCRITYQFIAQLVACRDKGAQRLPHVILGYLSVKQARAGRVMAGIHFDADDLGF